MKKIVFVLLSGLFALALAGIGAIAALVWGFVRMFGRIRRRLQPRPAH